jgi:ABC-type phosphate transport system substrate-binding protein
MKSNLLKLGFMLVIACLATFRAAALDGAVVIANSSVAADSLTADALKDIYTGKTKYWDGGQAVVIAVLPDKTDAALQQACGMDSSSFKTFWQRLAFSGRGQEPKKADDAAGLVALVASTKGAIALVPADAALNGVKKIEIK